MNNNYMINKIKQNEVIANFLKDMKQGMCKLFLAGGSIRSIATNSVIGDYDFYFADKDSLVAAVCYMKESLTYCSFISDKSITYTLRNTNSFRNALGEYEEHTTVQFIFYDYYQEAQDIFKHFDFTCCMGAYDVLNNEIVYHKDFWMHNSQRHLEVNTKTKFPLLTGGMRVQKYIDKGYSISRTEMMKVMVACCNLEINSWEEFKAQVGNLYGFNFLTDEVYKDLVTNQNVEFSLEAALEILEKGRFDTDKNFDPNSNYKYPPEIIDYVLNEEPLVEIEMLDGTFIFPEVRTKSEQYLLVEAVEDGVLSSKRVDLKEYLGEKVYTWLYESEIKSLNQELPDRGWRGYLIEKRKDISLPYCVDDKVLVECTYISNNVSYIGTDFRAKKLTPVKIIGYKKEALQFREGEHYLVFKPRLKQHKGSNFSCEGFTIGLHTPTPDFIAAKFRENFIREHVRITEGDSQYAKKTYKGVVLEGGESIKAKELLLYLDDYNLCFGGSCTILTNGTFSATVYTD